MNRIARLGAFVGLVLVALQLGVARAQDTGKSSDPRPASSVLSPVDYLFVAQANAGAPFQIDSGRLAETKAMTPAIREYARLMAATHVSLKDALDEILQRKGIQAPPEPLLQGAYRATMASLEAAQSVQTFERDYLSGQVEYQKGNAALFQEEIQNGADPVLKEFARAILPRVQDHLQQASKVSADVKRRLLTH
jgi:putative membrane protein